MTVPSSENAALVRTDFSDPGAWSELKAIISSPPEPFTFSMQIVDDPANNGATVEQLLGVLPEDYPHSFIVVADRVAISQPDFPVLVIDLVEERGRSFRAVAAAVPLIENNLSIANMDFEEFAGEIDEGGVFRGQTGL